MSSDNDIQTAIVTALKSITAIGQVYSYEPFYRQAQDLAAAYLRNGKIRGWFVVRDALVELPATIGAIGHFQNLIRTEWRITGFWETEEPGNSANDFHNMIDTMRIIFRENRNLNLSGVTTVTENRAGLEIIDTGLAQFCGSICHTVILGLTTERYIQ
jgi:predicted transposase YdaD